MDESKTELIRDWLMRASHDLKAARTLSSTDELDTGIYHCQQAGEKAVKAWLQSQDEAFPKTHDIEELVEQAAKLNEDFKQLMSAAEILTPYVSAFRYPSAADEIMPSRKEFDKALQHAQTIYDFILKLVPQEARPSN
jgi:HEPN domain-containing protein